jgi:hypothetical protein
MVRIPSQFPVIYNNKIITCSVVFKKPDFHNTKLKINFTKK